MLELDGNGSYVELPSDLLQGAEELTIEAWVNWSRLGSWARIFDLAGETTVFGWSKWLRPPR